jgi:hypothetical protein
VLPVKVDALIVNWEMVECGRYVWMGVSAPHLDLLHITYEQTAAKAAVSLADQHGQEDTMQGGRQRQVLQCSPASAAETAATGMMEAVSTLCGLVTHLRKVATRQHLGVDKFQKAGLSNAALKSDMG